MGKSYDILSQDDPVMGEIKNIMEELKNDITNILAPKISEKNRATDGVYISNEGQTLITGIDEASAYLNTSILSKITDKSSNYLYNRPVFSDKNHFKHYVSLDNNSQDVFCNKIV